MIELIYVCVQGEKAGEILRYLTFRLDFNDYHQQQREAASAGRGNVVGVSPLVSQQTLQQHQASGGGRGGSVFSFQQYEGRSSAGIQLDQDYSPTK